MKWKGFGEIGTSQIEVPREITKTTVRIARVPPEIRTEHLQKMSGEPYRYAKLLVSWYWIAIGL